MDFWALLTPILISAITSIATWFVARMALSRDNVSKAIESLSAELAAVKAENTFLREKVYELETRLLEKEKRENQLINQLAQIEAAHFDLPFPMWVKDIDFKMVTVNRAYELEFLRPLGKTVHDYLGHDDFVIWDQETAQAFRVNDNHVVRTNHIWSGIEMIDTGNGIRVPYRILKFPRQGLSGKVIGVAGLAVGIEKD